jgi:PAS domain S-box-containing protein
MAVPQTVQPDTADPGAGALARKLTRSVTPSGRERFFEKHELIVSKTDIGGKITYANEVFQRLAGLGEAELLGAPHSIIRHPDMPRCVFKLLWDTIAAGQEIFAYVINLAANGDHYWVFAHITPSFDDSGRILGYHSNRRVPDPRIVGEAIVPLYRSLLEEEGRQGDRKAGLEAATAMLLGLLEKEGKTYDEFILGL